MTGHTDLDALRDITRAIGQVPDELAQVDLVPGVHRALAAGAGSPRPRRRWGATLAATTGLAMAAAAVLWLVPGGSRSPGASDELVSRSGGAGQDRAQWAGIQLHRVSANAQSANTAPVRMGSGEALTVDDRLLFSYTNLGPAPFAFLKIFAVDANGSVHGLYPAPGSGDSPGSLAIAAGDSEVELPDLISHEFAPGSVAIIGLFSATPVTTSRVRGLLSLATADDDKFQSLDIAGTARHVVRLEVAP